MKTSKRKEGNGDQRLARARGINPPSDGLTCSEAQIDHLLSEGESTGEETNRSQKRMVQKSLSRKIRVK